MPALWFIAALATSSTTSNSDLAEHFKGLDGACWQSAYDNGRKDTRCFHVAKGNHLASITHALTNPDGSINQEGVAIVTMDHDSGIITNVYYNSGGFHTAGREVRVGNDILFYEEGATEPVAKWALSANSYQSVIIASGSIVTYVRVPVDKQ